MRVGIYAGSFDPIHAGHIGFALQALQKTSLDTVLFLPERHPRRKPGVTHYAHRMAMLKLALAAHPALDVLELPDRRFTVATSLPRLDRLYPADELFLLMGSDAVYGLGKWPLVDVLLRRAGLVIGMRGSDQEVTIRERLSVLPEKPVELHVLVSPAPIVS